MVTLAGAATEHGLPWMSWVLGGLALWLVVGLLVGTVLGRGIRLADKRARVGDEDAVLTTADLPASFPRAGAHLIGSALR